MTVTKYMYHKEGKWGVKYNKNEVVTAGLCLRCLPCFGEFAKVRIRHFVYITVFLFGGR